MARQCVLTIYRLQQNTGPQDWTWHTVGAWHTVLTELTEERMKAAILKAVMHTQEGSCPVVAAHFDLR